MNQSDCNNTNISFSSLNKGDFGYRIRNFYMVLTALSIIGVIFNSVAVHVLFISKNTQNKFFKLVKYNSINSLASNINDLIISLTFLFSNKWVINIGNNPLFYYDSFLYINIFSYLHMNYLLNLLRNFHNL